MPKTTKRKSPAPPAVHPRRTNARPGWLPDFPDQRDFLYAAPPVFLRAMPPKLDLRAQCPPVYDQGQLGSCTANAIDGAIALAALGYMRLRRFAKRCELLVKVSSCR